MKRYDGRGNLIYDGRERPLGLGIDNYYQEEDCTEQLPKLARDAGFTLVSFTPGRNADPYVLYDRYGAILKEWPEGYKPGWPELFELCNKLMN